ncbi:hypothetical protein [Rhodanobacter umsongensis]
MDGSIPATAEALHGESREHAHAGGFTVASRATPPSRAGLPAPSGHSGSGRVRHHPHGVIVAGGVCDQLARQSAGLPAPGIEGEARIRRNGHRPPAGPEAVRVHLMPPAQWKSATLFARSRVVNWATVVPAPAGRSRTPAMSVARTANVSLVSPATTWLLPPAWPLEGWRLPTATDMHRVVDTRIVPWARARMQSWATRAGASRYRLAAGIALCAIAGMAFVALRGGLPRTGVQPASASARSVVPATPAPAVFPSRLPPRPVPAAAPAAPVVAGTTVPSSSARPWPIESDRRLLSDVSTMDLMMPTEEPDLDIGSRQSLWSQVGKASGVDPLLLYSIALVESKALYPDGKVAPTPWLFRVNDHLVRGERHDVQLAMAAASQFGSAVQDVGIMQVYYPMHRDAVRDPLALLDPKTNITIAAKILRDGMRETRDPVLGVGYYHSHTPELARDYGTAVLAVYQRLKGLYRSGKAAQVAASRPAVHA